jgi:uncharacterized protein YdhG (YjbR/CyaY superfamily)
MQSKINRVDDYISSFPEPTQLILNKIRLIIINCEPGVYEDISYGMPAYKTYGRPLIYLAAFKNHIGLYATPSGHEKFADELSAYKKGKGSVQFPTDAPIPYNLIKRIVEFRIEENRKEYSNRT